MITRPFTCCCAVLAIASGFFLYTKKHQTTLLDQQISALVHETEHVRTQTAMLRTEWALENQPERLAQLASHHAPYLRTMDPAQFVRLSDLEEHLPAVDKNAPARTPVAAAPTPTHVDSIAMAAAPVAAPVRPVAVANTHPTPAPVMVADTRPAPQVAQPHILRLNTETPRATRPALAAPHAEPAYTTVATTAATPSATRANTVGHDTPGLQRTSTDRHTQVAALTPRPVIHKQDTAALDAAMSTPDTHASSTLAHAAAPASHHTTLVADDSAPQQVRHPLPMAAATWHPTRARHTDAIGRGYMEARATSGYTGGSLLSRGDSMLPPPVPVAN